MGSVLRGDSAEQVSRRLRPHGSMKGGVGPEPRLDAKELRHVRLLLRRPRFVIGHYPVETSSAPFVLAYAYIAIQMYLPVLKRDWWVRGLLHSLHNFASMRRILCMLLRRYRADLPALHTAADWILSRSHIHSALQSQATAI